MFQQILDTAKSDEELKGLIETWTEAMNDPDYTYETFLEAIEDMEKDLDTEADDTDESGFILRAWVDSDGEVVGRQFLLNDDEQEEELFGICVQRMEIREDFPCSWVPKMRKSPLKEAVS